MLSCSYCCHGGDIFFGHTKNIQPSFYHYCVQSRRFRDRPTDSATTPPASRFSTIVVRSIAVTHTQRMAAPMVSGTTTETLDELAVAAAAWALSLHSALLHRGPPSHCSPSSMTLLPHDMCDPHAAAHLFPGLNVGTQFTASNRVAVAAASVRQV